MVNAVIAKKPITNICIKTAIGIPIPIATSGDCFVITAKATAAMVPKVTSGG